MTKSDVSGYNVLALRAEASQAVMFKTNIVEHDVSRQDL